MVDKLTILIPHILMGIALWRLLARDDLDRDPLADPPAPPAFRRKQQSERTKNVS